MNCKNIRAIRLNALAMPKIRPDVALMERTLPATIRKKTLEAVCPPRIAMLSIPKNRESTPKQWSKPLMPLKYSMKQKDNLKNEHTVSARILELAHPKPILKNMHEECKGLYQEDNMANRKPILKKSSKANQQEWINRNARPTRRIIQTPVRPKQLTKMTSSQTKAMIMRLSTVPEFKKISNIHKQPQKKTEKLAPPKKKTGNLAPALIESVNRLSEPRKLASETIIAIEYDPYFIPLTVLYHRPSERTKKLAMPKAYDMSGYARVYRENPFEVSKSALKYKASERILQLAIPRQRVTE